MADMSAIAGIQVSVRDQKSRHPMQRASTARFMPDLYFRAYRFVAEGDMAELLA
jgi:hypothetical protein